MKRNYYFLFTVILGGMILASIIIFSKKLAVNAGPPVLTKNFIDLDTVKKISKFRSCQGHVVVPIDSVESKRNMKHYVILKPEYQNLGSVPLYAPYDARVAGIRSSPQDGLEGEIWLDGGNEWQFSFEHITLLESIKKDDRVAAGQLLGYVPARGFDIVYAVGASSPKEIDGWTSPFAALDSVFAHMGDEVFAEFQKYGFSDRETFSYSKEYRDENPCIYRDEQGGLNDFAHPEDWVILREL